MTNNLIHIYNDAYQFLAQKLDDMNLETCGSKIIDDELTACLKETVRSMCGERGVFYWMVVSLRERQGFPNFIGRDFEVRAREFLYDFDPYRVNRRYGDDVAIFMNDLAVVFPEKTIDAQKVRSAWYGYAKGILSIARFLEDFTEKEFFGYVATFTSNPKTFIALPMVLEHEIYGFGFTLACNFLKEAGYHQYGKSDVHLIDIFYGTGIVTQRNAYEVFKAIVAIAQLVGKEPVSVDKLFWMLGSGRFLHYNSTHPGAEIPVRMGYKREFIEYREKLCSGGTR